MSLRNISDVDNEIQICNNTLIALKNEKAKIKLCETIEISENQLSKIKDLCCKLDTKKLSSSALGDNTMYLPNLPGRISIDIMKVIQRDHNLVSYKLNSVAEHFIKDVKDDVTPAQIFAFQKGSADDRAIIAKYCMASYGIVLCCTVLKALGGGA